MSAHKDARLSPEPDRLAEIVEVYRTLGIDPTAPQPAGVLNLDRIETGPLNVTPLLSNNSNFD